MENERSFISDYQNDFNDYVKNEICKNDAIPTVATNVPKMSTIDERLNNISERINQLAMFVGVPHQVELDGNLTLYPARKNGTRKASDIAVSYTVDLKPYRGLFSEVRFKAMNKFCDDREIVRGIIVDDEGNVECASDNRFGRMTPWTRLPITGKSSCLVATVPLKDGKPAWVPEVVEFLPKGLAQDVANITEGLYRDACDMTDRMIPFKRECEKMFSKLSGDEVHLP